MNADMCMPFLGVNVRIEKVNVVNNQFTSTHRVTKKLFFKDSNNVIKNCNLRCEKTVCDGSCNKNVTMVDIAEGEMKAFYIT